MKILVVDDDATNRLVLKGILQKEQHEIVMAENGMEAIEAFRYERPDLILMDVMMPIMDGYIATRKIKEESKEHFVPIIFLTAMGGDDALVNCLEHGGDDYLAKPINRTVLVAKIKAMNRIRLLNETVHQQRHELALYKERIIREQEVAERIFANIMGRGDDDVSIINTYRKSAESFNGDIVLTSRNPGQGVNILVGDFTGHGLAAAIGAIPVAEIFYTMSAKGWEASQIVSEINRKITTFLPKGRFLAAAILQIDSSAKRITIWNGGMPDILVIDNKNHKIKQTYPSKHLPLGVLTPANFDSSVEYASVKNSDRLLVYSDGVTESENRNGIMFGIDRLYQAIENADGEGFIIQNIVDEHEKFRNGESHTDDVTLVEVDCDIGKLFHGQDKQPKQKEESVDNKNCELEFLFKDETLRFFDPIPMLLDTVTAVTGKISGSEYLFVLFSEMYNNALEHGILQLSSDTKTDEESFSQYYNDRKERLQALTEGWIKVRVQVEYTGKSGSLLITVTDSGKGYIKHEISAGNESGIEVRGRGLTLLKSLAAEVLVNEEGNEITTVYKWQD
ncbi:MAG: fused response regulator/phosphatase [Gammaproteobacteria bacterium]|nr:fused response regulator/phosphatase [Gammaproteobacteria bacterium]